MHGVIGPISNAAVVCRAYRVVSILLQVFLFGTRFEVRFALVEQRNARTTIVGEVSVPLAFICLLHLCNEKDLEVLLSPTADIFSYY
jgi:hypothetical protein